MKFVVNFFFFADIFWCVVLDLDKYIFSLADVFYLGGSSCISRLAFQ